MVVSFNDLPTEIIVIIFKYLDIVELLGLASVCKKWRSTIGYSFFNEQFDNNWLHCWKRVSSPQPVIICEFPKTSHSLYDPHQDCLLLFQYFSSANQFKCKIKCITNPISNQIENKTKEPVLSFNMKDSANYNSFTVEQEIKDRIINHITLENNEILLLDRNSFIYHIQYNLDSKKILLVQSTNSFLDKKPFTRKPAWCKLKQNDKEFLFICGGIYENKKNEKIISNKWKLYDCESKTFIKEGKMNQKRFYHSCTPIYNNSHIFISGGKKMLTMFTKDSILSQVEILNLTTNEIEELEMNHPRNLHESFTLTRGDIVILGGNNLHSIEKFDAELKKFYDIHSISLNWKSSITFCNNDRFIICRGNSKILEILDAYNMNRLLISSHTLPNLSESNDKIYQYLSYNETVFLLKDTNHSTSLYRIPFNDLRIMLPTTTDVCNRNDSDSIDGILYFLDGDFSVLESCTIFSTFGNEIVKTLIQTLERVKCKYLQLHFFEDISFDTIMSVIHLLSDASPDIYKYIGLSLKRKK